MMPGLKIHENAGRVGMDMLKWTGFDANICLGVDDLMQVLA